MQAADQLGLGLAQATGLGQVIDAGAHAHQASSLGERQAAGVTLFDLADLVRQRRHYSAQLMQLFAHANAAGQVGVETLAQLPDPRIAHGVTLGLLNQQALLVAVQAFADDAQCHA